MAHLQTPEERETQKTYNRLARLWDTIREVRDDPIRTWFYSQIPQGGRVLDVGCGTGKDARVAVAQNLSYVGVDYSLGMLRVGQRGASHIVGSGQVRFLCTDMHELALRPASFDTFVAVAFIQHIPRQSVWKVLSQVRRVLKPGALGFVTVTNGRYSEMYQSDKHECGRTLMVSWPPDEFAAVVNQAGLRVLQCLALNKVLMYLLRK